MFKLNKEIETKNGEIVKPFLVEGGMVYSFDRKGKTIIKDLKDFDFKKNNKDIMNIISVKKTKKKPKIIDEPVVELNHPKEEKPKEVELKIEATEKEKELLIEPIRKIKLEEEIASTITKKKKVTREKQTIRKIEKSVSQVEHGKIISNEEYV